MGKRIVAEGFLVTSDVVPFYGEAVLDEEDVRRIYETYSTQPVPMYANHNPAQVIDTETRLVELRRTEAGSLGVWVEVAMDEADWSPEYKGWSVGLFKDDFAALENDSRPVVRFGADAARFTPEEREAAADVLMRTFNVVGGRYYQFSELPPATVVLLMLIETVRALPVEVLGNLVYDALKGLLPNKSRSEQTTFTFSFRDRDREVRGSVTTSSEDVLRDVVGTFRDLVAKETRHHVYDPANQSWNKVESDRKNGAE